MVILYTYDKGNYINLKNITLEEIDAKNIKRNIYVNLTNRCPCACTFCLRKTKKMAKTNSLWLEREPEVSEVITEFESLDLNEFNEVIFCGFGEPTERIYDIVKIAEYLKKRRPEILIRINTNGLSDLMYKTSTAHLFKELMDTVSISLNAPNAEEFLEITQNKFGIESFEAMKKFALDCKNYVPNVVLTVVDCIGEEEIKKSQAVCDELGVALRVRAFE